MKKSNAQMVYDVIATLADEEGIARTHYADVAEILKRHGIVISERGVRQACDSLIIDRKLVRLTRRDRDDGAVYRVPERCPQSWVPARVIVNADDARAAGDRYDGSPGPGVHGLEGCSEQDSPGKGVQRAHKGTRAAAAPRHHRGDPSPPGVGGRKPWYGRSSLRKPQSPPRNPSGEPGSREGTRPSAAGGRRRIDPAKRGVIPTA